MAHQSSVLPHSVARVRAPPGAPSRLRASGFRQRHRRRVRASWDEALAPVPVQRAPRGGVLVPPGRVPGPPGSGVRSSPPAGAASRSIIATSREDALDEQDGWTIILLGLKSRAKPAHSRASGNPVLGFLFRGSGSPLSRGRTELKRSASPRPTPPVSRSYPAQRQPRPLSQPLSQPWRRRRLSPSSRQSAPTRSSPHRE